MFKIETLEHCIDGIVVSQKVIKLFGLPIFIRTMETSNYNYVGQFDANNFVSKQEEQPKTVPLYSETNIGFTNEKTKKECDKETSEGSNSNQTSI